MSDFVHGHLRDNGLLINNEIINLQMCKGDYLRWKNDDGKRCHSYANPSQRIFCEEDSANNICPQCLQCQPTMNGTFTKSGA